MYTLMAAHYVPVVALCLGCAGPFYWANGPGVFSRL